LRSFENFVKNILANPRREIVFYKAKAAFVPEKAGTF
jgi:hypothetical protein